MITLEIVHIAIPMLELLKSRLNQRKDFVKFVVNGLGSNVLQSFERATLERKKQSLSSLNEDSSNRVRSTRLTSRRVRHMTGVPSRPATHRHSGPDEKQALLTFHQELTETCVDLMTRYSFANCDVTPRTQARRPRKRR